MSVITNVRFPDLIACDPSVLSLDESKKRVRASTVVTRLREAPPPVDKALRSRWAKPTPAEAVTLQAAADALQRVFERLGASRQEHVQPHIGASTLREVEKQPMETLMLAATMLTVQALGTLAEGKGKALEIMAQGERRVRDHEAQELRQQIDKAIEQQHKAKKAGIFGAICDWVVSAVEVVSGVARIVGGTLSGDAMMVAGGAMDLAAGTAGLVKAVSETMALIDTEHADKWRSIAATAGKIQLAFEIAGAVVDITNAAQNMIVSKVIPKAAKTVLEDGAERVVAAAVKAGSKEAIESAAKQVTEQIVKEVSKEALDALGQQAIEKIVQNAIKNVAEHAAEKGVEVATKKLTKEIVKEIRRSVILAVVKASVSVIDVTRGVVGGANRMYSGVIELEKAKLQKEIDQLILDQEWLQALFDMYERTKKDAEQGMKDLIQGQGTAMEGGVAQMRRGAQVAQQGAASMAGVVAGAV